MLFKMFIAGLGGFIGTLCRYVLNDFIYRAMQYPLFPYGTFTINILGCFFIGLIASLAETRIISPDVRLFIQIGMLGGFTTFSSFGLETFNLLRDGQFILGAMNVLLQAGIGLLAVWLGYYVGQL